MAFRELLFSQEYIGHLGRGRRRERDGFLIVGHFRKFRAGIGRLLSRERILASDPHSLHGPVAPLLWIRRAGDDSPRGSL